MSTLISGMSDPLLWQKVLSQSPNISYSTRGVSRVHDTDPGRKGDYWFRDFGMVMACAYMTELSFRIVDKFFTIPQIAYVLQLQRLSQIQHPLRDGGLYKDVQNYDRLPEVFQNRMMGSLIRGSSALVPRVMREMADQDAGILDKRLHLKAQAQTEFSDALKALLKNPLSTKSNAPLESAIEKAGIARKTIQEISNIDNRDLREKKIAEFLKSHPAGTEKEVEFRKAVRLEDARQRGILIDHIERNQNYKAYVTQKYFDPTHPLKSLVPDFLTRYGNQVYKATHEDQEAMEKALNEIWHLPPDTRVTQFNKKFHEFREHFEVRPGQNFLSKYQLEAFEKLGTDFRKVLERGRKAKKDEWNLAKQLLLQFQKGLVTQCKRSRTNKLENNEFAKTLATEENLAAEFRDSLKKKLESTLDDIHRLIPGKNPQTEMITDIERLQLHRLFSKPETKTQHVRGKEHVYRMLNELKDALPERSEEAATPEQRKAISAAIGNFMKALEHESFETMIRPLLKSEGISLLKRDDGKTFIEKIERLVRDSIDSKVTTELIGKIQKSSGWPKAFLTVAFNFVFYGLAASKFDNNVLQPYQKKLVAERGTSQDIVNAGYLALIPGFAMLTQLFDKTTPLAAVRRLDSLSRFTVVGGAALVTFGAGTYFILQQLLKKPSKSAPLKPEPAEPFAAARPLASVASSPFLSRNNAIPALAVQPVSFGLPAQSPVGWNRASFPSSSEWSTMKPAPSPWTLSANPAQNQPRQNQPG